MTRLTITIDTDNAAFADGNEANETARILNRFTHQLFVLNDLEHPDLPDKLMDINGNCVGHVQIQGADTPCKP